ncbi:metallophosphoesterase family protein [Rhodobacteraceae bacterium]|nr:metallophosphoesterase family protein [Paracoccaceae bacterium]
MQSRLTDEFAVIADIHGNIDALDAVLADISARGIQTILNLGDHLSGPLEAARTADRLMAAGIACIRGNHDRQLLDRLPGAMGLSDASAYAQLTPAHLRWLGALPATLEPMEGVFAFHGTPQSDTTYLMEQVDAQGRVSMRSRAQIEAALQGCTAQLYLCGHTHVPRRIDLGQGRVVLNPGSVGCPAYSDVQPVPHVMQTGTACACYATLGRHAGGWHTSFHHIPYDTGAMVARAKAAGREDWAQALAHGTLT